jgi:tetratricopeptide (TPR) repeat protein
MLERQGDYEQALTLYADLFQKNGQHQQLFRSLLNLYKKSDKIAEGIIYFQSALNKNPNNMQIALTLIEFQYLTGDTLSTQQFYTQQIDHFGNRESFYRGVLQIYMRLGNENEMIDLLSQARLRFKPALFAQEVGHYYQVRRVFNLAMDEYILYVLNLGDRNHLISKRILKMSDEIESLTIIEKKITAIGSSTLNQNIEILTILADFYFKLQRYNDAFDVHLQLGMDSNLKMNRWLNFANQLQQEKVYPLAIKSYELILKSTENQKISGKALIGLGRSFEAQITPKTHSDLIDYYYNDNMFLDSPVYSTKQIAGSHLETSIAFYDSILSQQSLSKQSAQAHFRLGEIYYLVNQDFDRAIIQYEFSLKNRPSQKLIKKLHLRLADVYLSKGNPTIAFEYLDSLLTQKYDADYESKRILMGLHALPTDSVMLLIQSAFGRIKPTSPRFNDLMELRDLIQNYYVKGEENDKMAFSLFLKADMQLRQNKMSEALETLSYLQKLYPNSSIFSLALFRKSLIFNALNQHTLALESLTLLEETPFADRAIILTGQIYEFVMGDKEKALSSFHQILDAFPNSIYFEPIRYHIRKLEQESKNQ